MFRKISLIVLSTLCLISFTAGQSISVNYGVAGVENYDPANLLKIGYTHSLKGNQFCKLSFLFWSGKDNNSEFDYSSRTFYGSRALNFAIYQRYSKVRKISLAVGIGGGGYQKIWDKQNDKEYYYEGAVSINHIVKWEISDKMNIVADTHLAFEEFYLEFDGIVPWGMSWGFASLGLEYKIF